MRRPLLFLGTLLGVLTAIAVSHRIAWAEGINLFSDFEFLHGESDTFRKDTGQTSERDSTRFSQKYNLNVIRTLYPYLLVRGGGIFQLESIDSRTDGTAADRNERIIQPFLEINLNNPLYGAGVGYRRAEIKESASGIPGTRDTREEYNALLVWRPVDLPRLDLRYTRAHTFDEPESRDSVNDLFTLDTRYGFKGLELDYSYTFNENEDDIANLSTLQQIHQARVDYSRKIGGNRFLLATGYRINYSQTEFSGAGGSLLPILRSAGLFSLDDTPEDGPSLASNVSLIDGDLTASSGVDIGLAGDETTQTNIGIDFGFPSRVDTVFVWVDRSLSSNVNASFSWSVYTSPDNENTSTWTLHAVVFPATFGTFENRFEIVFPPVEARFLKVVTRPLSPAVEGASSFPNILVTEMEAFLRISSQETRTFTDTNHSYYLNLRGRVTDKTSTGYDLSLRHRESDPAGERRTSISNSVALTHIFSEIFTGSARLLRADTLTRGTDRNKSVSYNYSASLRASYIDTFGQILTYSGTYVSDEEGTGKTNSIFLRNNAQLYSDWSAILDLGYTIAEPQQGGRTTSAFTRVGTNLLPNRKVTINADYRITHIKTSGTNEERSMLEQQGGFQVSLTPLPTVFLVGSLRVIKDEDSSRTFQNYSANWSPFPEGTLQFFFTYSETLRSEDDQRDTLTGPSLRWKLTGYATLDLSYNVSESDNRIENIRSRFFRSNLKIIF